MKRLHLCSDRRSRRVFLADTSMGLTGMALGAMLPRIAGANDDAWTPPTGKPHFQPKAKRVIWLFMLGGVSHVESFDPKPALNKYAGKQLSETPVLFDGALQVRNYCRPDLASLQVVSNGIGEQPGHVLVSLAGELTEFVPDLLVDFGADFDGDHAGKA